MEIFIPEKKHIEKRKVWEILFSLLAIAGGLLITRYFFHTKLSGSTFIIFSIVLIFSIARELLRTRIHRIEFNTATREIIFHYKEPFKKVCQRTVSFDHIRLEVKGGFVNNLELYFVRGKFDLFKVSKHKDGFSNGTLENIRDMMAANGIKVSKY